MTIFGSARAKSLEILGHLGYSVSLTLPILNSSEILRTPEQIGGRLLGMYGVVSLSFGWDQRRIPVNRWLESERLLGYLTTVEREFVIGDLTLTPNMQWRLEALFALAWACNLTGLGILETVPDDFVTVFPSIATTAPTANFRKRLDSRSANELVQALDLLYCLHSAKTELHLQNEIDSNADSPHILVVQLRRQALEWLFSETPWEEIELDT